MDIVEQRQDGIVILAPAGRVDSTTSDALEQALGRATGAGDRRVIVDLGAVEYISSAGLRVLLVAARRIGGGALVLCSLAEPVRQVFDLAGFLPLFRVEASREMARARIASTP